MSTSSLLCGSTPTDCSAYFHAATGSRVQKLTEGPIGHELSYYDVPAWAPKAQRLVFNGNDSATGVWSVLTARPDGSDQQTLVTRTPPSTSAVRADLSYDGLFVSYLRNNSGGEPGFDLYGALVGNGTGPVSEIRITHQDYPLPTGTTNADNEKTSPAILDPATGHYLVAYSVNLTIYLVEDDGLGPDRTPGPKAVALSDPEQMTKFHRLKLNPKFPNLLIYWHGRDFDHWIIDWKNAPGQSVQWWNPTYNGTHPSETPDGLKVGIEDNNGTWHEVSVAGPDGRILPGLTPTTAVQSTIGTFGLALPAIYYTAYSDDGSMMAIYTKAETDNGGHIWLVNNATGKAVSLCEAHVQGANFEGHGRLRFFGDNSGIVFSTDDSWGQTTAALPQVYTVTNASGAPLTPP